MNQTATPKSPLLVAAIQLGLLMFIIYYTFIGGQTAQGIFDHNWRIITLWITSLLIGSWLLWRLLRPHLTTRQKAPRTLLDAPLLLLALSWILATLFSINPIYSQETIVFFITYFLFFYLAADLGRWPWFVELTFNAITAVSGLVWTLALLQLSWWYQDYAPISHLLPLRSAPNLILPRLSVLGNPNTMAGYIALVIPIGLYKLSASRKIITRLLLGLWLVMLLGALLLTQSRGGWLALVVGLGFYLAVWAFHKMDARPGSSLLNSPKSGASGKVKWGVVAAILLLVGLFVGLTLSFRGFNAGVTIRQQVMTGALKTWLKHPIFGAGPGALGEALTRYQHPLDTLWADAHNMFLTIVAETGVVGAIGLAWLSLVCLKLLRATLLQTPPAEWQMSSMACLAAILGFMAHGLVDSQLKFPLMMLMVSILAGFWISSYLMQPVLSTTEPQNPKLVPSKAEGSAKFWGYPTLVLALLIVIVNGWLGIHGAQNIAAYNQAVEAAAHDDWPAAASHLKEAYQLAPAGLFYERQLAFALGYLSEHEPAYRQEAISRYQTALETVDQLPDDHANLGCLLWADKRPEEALRELTLAQELAPYQPLYHLNLAYYQEQLGNDTAARLEYAYIMATWPDLVQSSFWYAILGWPKSRQQVEILAKMAPQSLKPEALSPLKLIDLYLRLQDTKAARQVYDEYLAHAAADPVAKWLGQGKILLATARYEEARLEFEAAIQANPWLAEAYLSLSKIALAENKLIEAKQYAEAALFIERNPTAFYQSARVHEALGQPARAIEHYEAAFAQLTAFVEPELTRYATEVARRRPLPASHLPCLVRIYPTGLLVEITQAEGDLLEQQGAYEEAARLYRRLLDYEPTIEPIMTRLGRLYHLGLARQP